MTTATMVMKRKITIIFLPVTEKISFQQTIQQGIASQYRKELYNCYWSKATIAIQTPIQLEKMLVPKLNSTQKPPELFQNQLFCNI